MPSTDQSPEDFLEMITTYQSRRMDDQRASLPYLPGLQDPARVLGPHLEKRKHQENGTANAPKVPQRPQAASASRGTKSENPDAGSEDSKLLKIKSLDIAQPKQKQRHPPEESGGVDEDFYEMLIKCQVRMCVLIKERYF